MTSNIIAPEKESVCAVVITYNTGDAYLEKFEAIRAQVGKVVIIDNGSDAGTLSLIDSIKTDYPDAVELIKNTDNLGLAAAQNQGITLAMEKGFEWILLLDDDSKPAPDMVQKQFAALTSYPSPDGVAIIAPESREVAIDKCNRFVVPYGNIWFKRVSAISPYLDNVMAVIASGSLIRSECFKQYGLLKEGFFIDYIDTEFSLRLISEGKKILVTKDAILHHRLGDKTSVKLGPMNITPSHHSPKRRYTIYRNRIWVWRSYIFKVPTYILYDMIASVYDIFRILCFEQNRTEKLKQLSHGIIAGLFTRPPTI